jgi:ABC-2 type transport system ATP-binding protein
MALAHRPRVLFLDEPTVGADVETRQQVLAAVRELAGAGAAVVYCTHYLPEIEALDARVAVLAAGRIVADGPVRDLVAAHTESSVDLVFEGEPPPQLPGRRVPDTGLPGPGLPGGGIPGGGPGLTTLSVPSTDPSATLGALLAALGPATERLRSVELRRPSLEAAYLALVAGHSATRAGTVGAGTVGDGVVGEGAVRDAVA